jgi:putative ABC transport system substrate-binding protein
MRRREFIAGFGCTAVSSITARAHQPAIPERLDMLHQLVPAATSMAMLVNPTNMPITEATVAEGNAAAPVLGVDLLILNGSDRDENAAAFSSAVVQHAGGSDLFYYSNIEYLVALGARHAIPVNYEDRVFTAVGGLIPPPDQNDLAI